MSESRTDTSAASPPEGGSEHERDHEEFQAGTGYQPSTNQAQDEPVPASHHDEGRQKAARRRGEPAGDDPAGGGQAGSGRADDGQADEGHADGGNPGRGQASHDETGQDG